MERETPFDEKKSFDLIKAKISKIDRLVNEFKKINSNSEDSIEKLNKFIQLIPEPSDFTSLLDEVKKDLQIHITEVKKFRSIAFKKIYNEYISQIQKANRQYRIVDNNVLRIGVLELKTDPKNFSVRFFFNEKALMEWKTVRNTDDIEKYEKSCLNMLENAKISENSIENIFYKAYMSALRDKRKEKSYNQDFISISHFYNEVQIELFRQQLNSKKPGNSISIEFPVWAFLYNLDLYRKMKTISSEKRIFLETGSQKETEKKGVVLNGLDPLSDYKMFCYVRGSGIVNE